jgi:hypothetical protein
LPMVDLMQSHQDDFASFKDSSRDYLAKYWIGHYNPLGNHFCANAIRPQLIELLEPKPLPYRAGSATTK